MEEAQAEETEINLADLPGMMNEAVMPLSVVTKMSAPMYALACCLAQSSRRLAQSSALT